MEKIPLTVVVLTKNEEDNIVWCLQSVAGWANEIILVDDASTDRTVELAGQFAPKILHRRMENEGIHRNWAYAQASNEWVLSLDADEMVMPELRAAIATAIKSPEIIAYGIPLRNYIGNYWVRHSGWYPARKLRLFKKNHFKYEEAEVHPRVILDGKEQPLHADIIHKGYPDFEHFFGSVNRQTTWEAQKWLRMDLKITLGRVGRRAIDRFLRKYFKGKAFRDGVVGLMIACFSSLYEVASYAKYWELKKKLAADQSPKYRRTEISPSAFSDEQFRSLSAAMIEEHTDFENFLTNLNAQSTTEARQRVHRNIKMTTGRAIQQAMDRFFRVYLKGRAFKDGIAGFMIAYFASLYEILIYAKYWEIKNNLQVTPNGSHTYQYENSLS